MYMCLYIIYIIFIDICINIYLCIHTYETPTIDKGKDSASVFPGPPTIAKKTRGSGIFI